MNLDKRHDLLRKWQISGKLLQGLVKGFWVSLALVTWFINSKIMSFVFWKFQWVLRDVGGTLQIIKKTADFWKILKTLAKGKGI